MATASSSSAKDASPSPPPAAVTTAADGGGDATATASASPARSPSPLPLPAPPPPPTSSSRRLPPPCWTHEETLALIDSYREKWYALRRGNLRASHWQEVADAVVGRCLRLPAATPKTSVQCRHKIEKLRKRYRSERLRSLSHEPSAPPSSSWAYFRKMDAMEHGGGGGSAPRTAPSPAPARSDDDDDENDEDEEEEDDARRRGGGGGGNTRSLHRLMVNGGGGSGIGSLRFTIPKAVRSKIVGSRVEERAAPSPRLNPNPGSRFFSGYGGRARPAVAEEMKWRMEKKRRWERESESDAAAEVVSALRTLGDGFMRMEQMKMEMAREMEKVRMEMELKRTEMILDSQRRIVDAFVKGFFGDKKRAKISPDS